MFFKVPYEQRERGVSFIELIVGAAVLSLIFGGLLGSFQFLLTMIANSKSEAGAVSIINEQIEYLRALPYDDVGTQSGIPAGNIPQNSTTTLNDIDYGIRTLIQYVDAPEDGEGAGDTNGITADYKRAKVEVTWDVKGQSKSLSFITNIVPPGIETIAGGGTLVVNVFDAAVQPVETASVQVINSSTSPTVDVTSFTNAQGTVMFPGALAGGGYEIYVTKPGYSSSQTYSASTSNPNPNPAHVAVAESLVSTVNFAIDRTATVTVRTISPPTTGSFADPFDDASLIAEMATTTVGGGLLTLTGAPGPYPAVGEVYSTSSSPSPLDSWDEATWTDTEPANTSITYQVYSVSILGVRTLIPDVDLPGNSAGFGASPINLSGLSPGTYPRLALGATLQSTDGVSTPSIDEWVINYTNSVSPIGNVNFHMRGTKTIGTDGGGAPIYKYDATSTTDGSGEIEIGDLEWDQYTITIDGAAEGYDISEACDPIPFIASPNSASTTELALVAHTANSLLTLVNTVGGDPISGANIRLTRTGVDETRTSSSCGQGFISSLPSASDYTLEVSASGYVTETITNFDVTGQTSTTVQLST